MSTTANDIVKGALREINVLASGEDPTASEAQDALTKLNEMIAGWEMEGISIGDPQWALSTTVALPVNHIAAIKYGLAARLAPEYGVTVSSITVQLADDGYRNLQTAYGEPLDMTIDGAIRGRARSPNGRPV